MSQPDDQNDLLKDLEAIRQSLDRIARSEPAIPLLEEVVGKRTPTHVNPGNPFLSSQSLSELIRIRNEAEARAAEELAALEPLRPIGEILQPRESARQATPDPTVIHDQLETLFASWADEAVDNYVRLFELELRNRLQQDFRELVARWFHDNDLPVPDHFIDRDDDAPEPRNPPR